jgi:hypothetical protein
MARFATEVESQTAMAAGAPSGTTVNGYMCAVVGSSTTGFVLRRAILGVRAGASVPTSQQMTVRLYRQTARASGTGLSNVAGTNCELLNTTDPTGGIDYTTATTLGTGGPTLGGVLHEFSFNTQSAFDIPAELLERWEVTTGTANGLAFVNIGNALPASHLFTISLEWEV